MNTRWSHLLEKGKLPPSRALAHELYGFCSTVGERPAAEHCSARITANSVSDRRLFSLNYSVETARMQEVPGPVPEYFP